MSCDKYVELISAALDGELTAEERRELDAHLAACPECAALFEELSAQSCAMRELDCSIPAGLHDRVMSNLPAQDAPAKKGKIIHWKRWGTLAACVALVVVAAVAAPSFDVAAPTAAESNRSGSSSPDSYETTPDEAEATSYLSGHDNGSEELQTPMAPESVSDNAQPSDNLTPESQPSAAPESTGPAALPEAEPSETVPPAQESSPVQFPGREPYNPPSQGKGDLEFGDLGLSNVQRLRVTWGMTPEAPSALVLANTDSLAKYLAQFPANDLSSLTAAYTADFFEDHCLLAVLVESGSGSTRFEIASVSADTVTVRTIVPEVGTWDMAAWLLLVELDEMLDDGSTLNVVFSN